MASGVHGVIFGLFVLCVLQNFFFKSSSLDSEQDLQNVKFSDLDNVFVNKMSSLNVIHTHFGNLDTNRTKYKHSSPRPVSRNTVYVILSLLLSGDLELNPGPVTDPCGVCSKGVRKNQQGIACDSCDVWFPQKMYRYGHFHIYQILRR